MAVKTYKKGDTAKLSKNFSVYELSCRGVGCCSTTLVSETTVGYLQAVRDHFGVPVTPTSGHRCEKHNRSVGGETASRHVQGRAVDFVVQGVAPRRVAAFLESIGCKGIGLYETAKDGHFVHCDDRTTKSFWYGQAQAYRSTFGGAAAAGTTTAVTGSTAASYSLAQFVTDVQKATGAGVDGLAGPKTLGKTVTISKSKNRRHAAVLALQKRLKALGYDAGSLDGIAGKKFDEALKAFQFDHDCVVDGEATKGGETWQKLLGMK